MDVLGFSQMVRSDSGSEIPEYLPIFRKVLAEVRNRFDGKEGLDVKMFSDSVVISAPLSPENVGEVANACAVMQCQFLAQGILLRGGISFGKHFSDDLVLFSSGMILAYELESKRAKFPRIVVDKNLLDYFLNYPGLKPGLRNNVCGIVLEDPDGCVFIDYLFSGDFVLLSKSVEKLFSRVHTGEDGVLEKMRWLHDYHSYCATRLSRKDLLLSNFKSGFSLVG